MSTIATLKAELRIAQNNLNRINDAIGKINASNFTSINDNGSFAYIASNENMNSYWNLGKIGEESIRILVQNELNQIDTDLNSLKSFSSELLSKAEEKINELKQKIESLTAEIARLEAEENLQG